MISKSMWATMHADNVTLPQSPSPTITAAIDGYLLLAGPQPQTCSSSVWRPDETDKLTYRHRQTPDRYVDTALHTMQAVSKSQLHVPFRSWNDAGKWNHSQHIAPSLASSRTFFRSLKSLMLTATINSIVNQNYKLHHNITAQESFRASF